MRRRPKRSAAPVPGTSGSTLQRHVTDGAGPVVVEVHVGPVVTHREPAHRHVAQVTRRVPDDDLLCASTRARRRSAAGPRRRRGPDRPRAGGRSGSSTTIPSSAAASPTNGQIISAGRRRPGRCLELVAPGHLSPRGVPSAPAGSVGRSGASCRVISSSTSTSHVTCEPEPSRRHRDGGLVVDDRHAARRCRR